MKMLKRVDVFMLLVIGAIIGTLVLWFVWITLMSVSAQGAIECQACANVIYMDDPYPGSTPRPTPTIAPFPQPNVIERAWLPIVLGGN